MMTKEEWEKKWPQLAYNPSLLEGDNADKSMSNEAKYQTYLENKEKDEARFQKIKPRVIQTPAQEAFNNDPDF